MGFLIINFFPAFLRRWFSSDYSMPSRATLMVRNVFNDAPWCAVRFYRLMETFWWVSFFLRQPYLMQNQRTLCQGGLEDFLHVHTFLLALFMGKSGKPLKLALVTGSMKKCSINCVSVRIVYYQWMHFQEATNMPFSACFYSELACECVSRF